MWQKNMHHFVLARWWEQHKSWFLYRMLESDFTSSREASVAANDSSSSSPEFSYPCMKSPSYLSVSRQVLNLWLHGSWLIMIVISRFISFLSVCVCVFTGSTCFSLAVGSTFSCRPLDKEVKLMWTHPGHPPGNHRDLSPFVLAGRRWRLHSDTLWTPWISQLKTRASFAAAHATCWFGKVCRWKMRPSGNLTLCYGNPASDL